MNKTQSKEIKGMAERLAEFKDRLGIIADGLEETLETMPEKQKYEERGVKMANVIDCLLYSIDLIGDAVDALEDAGTQEPTAQ